MNIVFMLFDIRANAGIPVFIVQVLYWMDSIGMLIYRNMYKLRSQTTCYMYLTYSILKAGIV